MNVCIEKIEEYLEAKNFEIISEREHFFVMYYYTFCIGRNGVLYKKLNKIFEFIENYKIDKVINTINKLLLISTCIQTEFFIKAGKFDFDSLQLIGNSIIERLNIKELSQ